MSLDLERQLTAYGVYHRDTTNVAIHVVCVPLILLSSLSLATYSGTVIPTPDWLTIPYLDLNLGTIGAIAYASLYVLLEPVAGSVFGLFCLACAAVGNYCRLRDPGTTLRVSLGIEVFSWIAQLVGHAAFEGRAPALLQNLVQALVLAPIFVWLEILFKLGYRPELQSRVRKAVELEVAKFKTQPKNGKAD